MLIRIPLDSRRHGGGGDGGSGVRVAVAVAVVVWNECAVVSPTTPSWPLLPERESSAWLVETAEQLLATCHTPPEPLCEILLGPPTLG